MRTKIASARLDPVMLAVGVLCSSAGIAAAGAVVPAPLAGVLGPAGLLMVGAAWGGYLLVKKLRR